CFGYVGCGADPLDPLAIGPRQVVKRALLVAAVVAVATSAIALLAVSRIGWDGWRPASCLVESGRCFNEAPRAGPIRQPANTWSNLAYVLVAAWIAVTRGGAAPCTRPAGRLAWAGPIFALGITSTLFHASLTWAWEWCDVVCMFLWASVVVVA